jgi:hypothetical protein
MPSLDDLNLTEDAAPAVDWDAPEQGKTPPAVFPGLYTLRFAMGEDVDNWFDAVERETIKGQPTSKRKFLELTYQPFVIANSEGQPISLPDGEAIQLGPQRASTFMNAKMRIHALAELMRAMGVRVEGSFLAKQDNGKMVIENVVRELDGKATFKAELIWRAYFKSTDTTISSHPRGKKSGELLWPRDANGQCELLCKNPQTGETSYAYVEVARVKLPTSAEGSGGETLAAGA